MCAPVLRPELFRSGITVTRPPLPFTGLRQRWSRHRNFLIQHSSRVLADSENVFLRKPIRARVFASTPVHLAGRGDGAWETTTAFRSRRRAPGDGVRSPACGEAKERRGARWWEASSFRRSRADRADQE